MYQNQFDSTTQVPENPNDPASIGALITGIIALISSLAGGIFALPYSISALILSAHYKKKYGKHCGFTSAGNICGIISIVLSILMTILYFVIFIIIMRISMHDGNAYQEFNNYSPYF